jgi:hypothetical protein
VREDFSERSRSVPSLVTDRAVEGTVEPLKRRRQHNQPAIIAQVGRCAPKLCAIVSNMLEHIYIENAIEELMRREIIDRSDLRAHTIVLEFLDSDIELSSELRIGLETNPTSNRRIPQGWHRSADASAYLEYPTVDVRLQQLRVVALPVFCGREES